MPAEKSHSVGELSANTAMIRHETALVELAR